MLKLHQYLQHMESVAENNKNRAKVLQHNIDMLNAMLKANEEEIDLAEEKLRAAKAKVDYLKSRREKLQDDRARQEGMLRGEGD